MVAPARYAFGVWFCLAFRLTWDSGVCGAAVTMPATWDSSLGVCSSTTTSRTVAGRLGAAPSWIRSVPKLTPRFIGVNVTPANSSPVTTTRTPASASAPRCSSRRRSWLWPAGWYATWPAANGSAAAMSWYASAMCAAVTGSVGQNSTAYIPSGASGAWAAWCRMVPARLARSSRKYVIAFHASSSSVTPSAACAKSK